MADADAGLVTELDDLARHLVVPDPNVDVVAAALARIRGRSRHSRTRRLLAVAAIIVVIGLVLTFVAPARRAVADWIGIGGTRVTSVDRLPDDLGSHLDLGRAIDVDAAQQRAPAISFPDTVDAPAAAYVGRPEGGVSFVWSPSRSLPEVPNLDVGLLLTTYPGAVARPSIEKLLPPGTAIDSVDVNGANGYWLSGAEHAFVYLDDAGEYHQDRARLAANTLLWVRDGTTYRLESALDRADALRLARGFSSG